MSARSLSAEARGIGEYVADFRLFDHSDHEAEPLAFSLDLRGLETLRTHIDVAMDRLRERQLSDAVCGPCELCDNTRMIVTERHGSPWNEHCPTCRPRLDAANAALKAGRPPEAQS